MSTCVSNCAYIHELKKFYIKTIYLIKYLIRLPYIITISMSDFNFCIDV